MIITCNECDTRFNLDESLLKQTGSKVRCSKCKNIFTAYPVEEAATGSQEEIDFSDIDNFLEMDVDLKAEKEPESEPEELDLEIDETPVETEAELELDMGHELHPENDIDEIPVETETELDLELDDKISTEISEEEEPEGIDEDRESEESKQKDEESDLELDMEIDKTPAETEAELELDMGPELHLENDIDEIPVETETELDLELDDKISTEISEEEEPEGIDEDRESEESKQKDEESDLELDMEIDKTPAETEVELEFELDMEPEIDESKQEDIEQDESIEKYTAEKIAEEKETSKTFNIGTLSDEQEDEKTVEFVDKVRKGASIEEGKPQKTAASKPVLLLLFATLLIGGVYGTYVLLDNIGINIPFVSNFLKPKVQDSGNLKIYISDINNKFVENSKIGKLLVITGKAKNEYSDARSYISIISKLYTKGKILSKTKTVYCGTVLAELDLINMELDSITNRLSNRFGDNKSNVKVKAGATIPFMVVFDDLPENLDEFTIEVARSLPL